LIQALNGMHISVIEPRVLTVYLDEMGWEYSTTDAMRSDYKVWEGKSEGKGPKHGR
jgi:hypothetical protein